MFTPAFWKNSNVVGEALYRINQSPYKEYCEIDHLFSFMAETFPDERETIDLIFSLYADYVEEQTRLRDLKKALNESSMKKEVKYKVLEAQL